MARLSSFAVISLAASAAINAVIPSFARGQAVVAGDTAYTWNGAVTGTSASANGWNIASNWNGAVPVSSATTEVIATNYFANSYTALNNIASPFNLNNFTFNTFNYYGATTENSLSPSSLSLTGASPSITVAGPGTDFFASTGNLTLNPTSGTTTINGSGNGSLIIGSFASSNTISGTGGLTINDTGLGVVHLWASTSSANITYTGGVTLTAGNLAIYSSYSLGSNTLTINGGTIEGSIYNSTTPNNANHVIANSDFVVPQYSLIQSGSISGAGGVHVQVPTYASAQLTLSGSNSYTGATTIDSAPLNVVSSNTPSLTLSGSGTLGATSSITVGRAGYLVFKGSNARVPAGAPVTLNGGGIAVTGLTSAFTESMGSLTVSGQAIFQSSGGTTANTLNFNGLTQYNHGTLFLIGDIRGANSSVVGVVNFGALNSSAALTPIADPAGSSVVGLLPYATGVISGSTLYETGFVTYDATGAKIISPTDASVAQFGSGTTFDSTSGVSDQNLNFNVQSTVAAPVTLNTTQTVNAVTNTALTILAGSGTLNVYSGVVMANSFLQFNGPTLNFGTKTGYMYQGGGQVRVTGTSSIQGSGGVVLSGSNGISPSFQFDGSVANTFTGGLFLNGTTLAYTADNQLGATGGGISLNGGQMYFNSNTSTSITLARPVTLGPAGGGIFVGAADTMTVSGIISGPGAFVLNTGFAGIGTTYFTNTNTYTGGTNLYQGTLNILADANLGSGGVNLSGGTLQFGASTTLTHSLTVNSNSQIDTSGNNVTLATPMLGRTSPSNSLTKVGAGTLSIAAANPNLSAILGVTGGTLVVSGSGSINQVPYIQVGAGGTFQLDDSAGNLPNRINSLVSITNAGGVLQLTGNASSPSSETFKQLDLGNYTGSNFTSTITVDPASATLTATGPTSGFGTLTKTGAGTLVIGPTSNASGGTLVNGGTLKLSGAGSLGFGAPVLASSLVGSGTVPTTTVNTGGSLDLNGQTITEPLTLSGGSLINSSATPATLALGVKYVTVSSGGLGYSPTDKIVFSGGSGATASPVLGLTSSSFTIVSPGVYYSGTPYATVSGGGGTGTTLQLSASNFDDNGGLTSITVVNPGYGYTATSQSQVQVSITFVGTASGAPTNVVPTVVFNPAGYTIVGTTQLSAGSGYSGSSSVSVTNSTGGASAGSGASFGTPVLSSLAISGANNIGGTGNISILPGISETGGPSSLTKIGSDTVTLASSNTYSGGTVVNAGLLIASSGVSSLGTGLVTVNGGAIIFRNTSASTIFTMLQNGFDAGDWNGSSGINSTAAATDPLLTHGVGMRQTTSTTIFEGQSLTASDVAVKYTYYGDTNLDGKVDGSDYSVVDNAFVADQLNASAYTGWQNGDFNYDGVVDGSDYTLMDNAYNQQGATIALQIANPTAAYTAQVAGVAGSALVPEPATFGLLGAGALGLLGRRRKRTTNRAK